MWMLMKMFPIGSPWCPGHPLLCPACLQVATDLLKLEQVVTPQNQCFGEMVKLAVLTPPGKRSKNIECWALVTISLDSIVDIRQHKEGTSDSSQWCLQPAGLKSPWRRNYEPLTMLIPLLFLDYSEEEVIIAPWKSFQIIWRGLPHTDFVSMTDCLLKLCYKNSL